MPTAIDRQFVGDLYDVLADCVAIEFMYRLGDHYEPAHGFGQPL